MLIIGFTGSRELTVEEELQVEIILWRLNGDKVITGACTGLDEFVAKWFIRNRPRMNQKIFVPVERSRVNMEFIDYMRQFPNVEVVTMPMGTNYRDRNLRIVDESNVLIGFPRYRESHVSSLRSGTWQTIRFARIQAKKVSVHILSELVDKVNPPKANV